MFVIWRVFEFDYYLIVIFTKELYGTINTINHTSSTSRILPFPELDVGDNGNILQGTVNRHY